jgi:hypothetical protein
MSTALDTRPINPVNVTATEAAIDAVFNGESISAYLKDVGFPPTIFYETLDRCPDLSARYARAKKYKAEAQVDEIVEIADTDPDPQRARNRIQARQWAASKLSPHIYGDKLDLNVTNVVDLGGALSAAKARVRPISDQPESEVIQDVEFKEINDTQPTDTQSHAPIKPADA